MTTSAVNFQSKPSFSTHLLAISSKRIDKFFRMRDTLNSIYTERLEPLYFRKGQKKENIIRWMRLVFPIWTDIALLIRKGHIGMEV